MVLCTTLVALLSSSAAALQPRLVEHPVLQGLKVGEEVGAGDVRVRRLSGRPSAFLLRNMLDPSDCERIAEAARAAGMERADTVCGNAWSRRRCDVAWLTPPRELTEAVAGLLLSDEARLEPGGGCEDLQVLRYADGGSYSMHHDTAREAPRALTVLYYLNGVGNTWLPLADDAPPPRSRVEALGRAEERDPERDGVRVGAPGPGDALAFFNFDADTGGLDWSAVHTALPCDGEKWIANHWFHVGGLFAEELAAQEPAAASRETAPA